MEPVYVDLDPTLFGLRASLDETGEHLLQLRIRVTRPVRLTFGGRGEEGQKNSEAARDGETSVPPVA